jgi:hypothetical protein
MESGLYLHDPTESFDRLDAMRIFMTCHLESIALEVKLSAAARQVCSISDHRRTVERWDLSRWRAAPLCALKLTFGSTGAT